MGIATDLLATSAYLPIFNGILITDIVIIGLTLAGFFSSKYLTQYYKTYGIAALFLDVLIIAVGFVIARALYPMIFGNRWSIWKFLGLLLIIQICHDTLFYLFIKSVNYGKHRLIDMLKDYAAEVRGGAILGDSFMMILSGLVAYWLVKNVGLDGNIGIAIISLYLAIFAAC